MVEPKAAGQARTAAAPMPTPRPAQRAAAPFPRVRRAAPPTPPHDGREVPSELARDVHGNAVIRHEGAGVPLSDRDGSPGRRPSHERAPPDRDAHDDATLDPLYRTSAQLAPPCAPCVAPSAPPPADAVVVHARASIEQILPMIVRRIAWSGDGKKGAVRIELGAGALAGATVLVEADEGRVRVRIDAPPSVDAEAWKARIFARFAARRIALDSLDID